MRVLLGVIGGLATLAWAGGTVWAAHPGEPPAAVPANAVPVIVELFSSEGCSSCPPADAWLRDIDHAQSVDGVAVLALEEHVDYWDRLGWRDPFGQAQFSDRQHDYARVLPDRRVFTPEIVVDGRTVETGDDEQTRRDLRASAVQARARVSLARRGDHLAVDVTDIPADADEPTEVWVAITESGLTSDVASGENAGHRLAHAPVVRVLRKVGVASGGAFHGETSLALEPAWAPRALRFIAFVQRARTKAIVGANSL